MSESDTAREHAEIAAPIKIALRHPTIAGPDPQAAAAANAKEFVRAYAEILAKLELLFPHFNLARTGNDAADFQALALRMAPGRFRGFDIVDVNERKPSYQHKRGNPVTLMVLLADVETVKREKRGCSDSNAIHILTTSARFACRWGDSREDTLKNWLCDAHDPSRNKMLPLWRLAAAADQLPAMIEVFGSASR